MTVRLSSANLFAQDAEALCAFYAAVFGLHEIESARSPIYRALDAGACAIGFNALAAYQLLGLDGPAGKPPADTMLTFDTPNPDDVEALVGVACHHGAKLVKPPYQTYYNTLQAVLLDPEGNIFRINHMLKA